MDNILLLASVALALAAGAPAPGVLQVPLQPEDIKTRPVLMRNVMQTTHPRREKPPGLRAGPQVEGTPFYGGFVPARRMLHVAVVAQDAGIALFLDTDRDGDLSDEEPVRPDAATAGRPARQGWVGPVSVEPASGEASRPSQVLIHVRLLRRNLWVLTLYPARWMSGELELAGKTHRIGVLDKDLDGRCESRFGPGSSTNSDWMGLDADGDGRLEGEEVMPLPRLARLGETYYKVDVAVDGSSLTLRETDPSLGRLALEAPGLQLVVNSESGVHHLTGREEPWSLPAGFYQVVDMGLEQTDEKGRLWKATATDRGELTLFNIHPDQTLRVEAGPPITVEREVSFRDGICAIGIAAHGRAGEEYSTQVTRDGQHSPPPKVRIRSRQGEVLDTGRFRYG